jgi:GntR family transcriptional regulator
MSPITNAEPSDDSGGIASLGAQPLAERARAEILSAILTNRFVDRLPPEDKLAKLLSVSRTTVRAALNSLEREGVVTRRRAIGTLINRHIAPSALMLQNLVGFDWLLREQGHEVDIEVKCWRGIPESGFLQHFGLISGCEYLLTEKAYLADGRMALYARDFVMEDAIAIEPEPGDEIPASLFEFSKAFCSHPIDHAVAQIAVGIKGESDTKLPIDVGGAFVRLYETHYSRDAKVLAHSVIDVDDAFIRFEVFRRQQS